MEGSFWCQTDGANGIPSYGLNIAYQMNQFDPKGLDFVIYLVLRMHQFQKYHPLNDFKFYPHNSLKHHVGKCCKTKMDYAPKFKDFRWKVLLYICTYIYLVSISKCTANGICTQYTHSTYAAAVFWSAKVFSYFSSAVFSIAAAKSNIKNFSHLQMDIFCNFDFCHCRILVILVRDKDTL